MPGQNGAFRWVERVARITMIAAVAIALAVLAVTVAMELARARPFYYMSPWMVSYSILFAIGVLALAGAAVVAYGVVRVLAASQRKISSTDDRIARIESVLDDLARSERRLVELAVLSDQAKSLIYREQELDAFRELFHAALIRQDYKAAESLAESLDKRLGYADEAGAMRKQIGNSRSATEQEKIDTAVARVGETLERHDWARALREAQRLAQMYPANSKVAALPGQVESARSRHKRDLLHAYGDAVRKNDVDRGIELLKELDKYLSPQEAAALEESARGVFRAKLHNLGVQFAIRVTEEQWADAVMVGEEIMNAYPNTRMAQEVSQKMELLRSRAAENRP